MISISCLAIFFDPPSPGPYISALTYDAQYPKLKLCTGRNTGKNNINRGTTGLLAVAMMLHICKQVTLFGFGQPRNGTGAAPYHYYTVRRGRLEMSQRGPG
jgi:hypothetical protein